MSGTMPGLGLGPSPIAPQGPAAPDPIDSFLARLKANPQSYHQVKAAIAQAFAPQSTSMPYAPKANFRVPLPANSWHPDVGKFGMPQQAPAGPPQGPAAAADTTQYTEPSAGSTLATARDQLVNSDAAWRAAMAEQEAHPRADVQQPQFSAPTMEKPNTAATITELVGAAFSPKLAPFIGQNISAEKAQREQNYARNYQAAQDAYKAAAENAALASARDDKLQTNLETRVRNRALTREADERNVATEQKNVRANEVATTVANARAASWIAKNVNDSAKLKEQTWFQHALIGVADRKASDALMMERDRTAGMIQARGISASTALQVANERARVSIMIANANHLAQTANISERATYAAAANSANVLLKQYDGILNAAGNPNAPPALVQRAIDLMKPGSEYFQAIDRVTRLANGRLALPAMASTTDVMDTRSGAFEQALSGAGIAAPPAAAPVTVVNAGGAGAGGGETSAMLATIQAMLKNGGGNNNGFPPGFLESLVTQLQRPQPGGLTAKDLPEIFKQFMVQQHHGLDPEAHTFFADPAAIKALLDSHHPLASIQAEAAAYGITLPAPYGTGPAKTGAQPAAKPAPEEKPIDKEVREYRERLVGNGVTDKAALEKAVAAYRKQVEARKPEIPQTPEQYAASSMQNIGLPGANLAFTRPVPDQQKRIMVAQSLIAHFPQMTMKQAMAIVQKIPLPAPQQGAARAEAVRGWQGGVTNTLAVPANANLQGR